MTTENTRVEGPVLYTISRPDRSQFVIFNASAIGNPPDLMPNKWYFRPYPVTMGIETTPPFETAAEAEEAARNLAEWGAYPYRPRSTR